MPQIKCEKRDFHITNPNKDQTYRIDVRTNKLKKPLHVISNITLSTSNAASWKVLLGMNNNMRPTYFIQRTAEILTIIRVVNRYPRLGNGVLSVDVRHFRMISEPTVGVIFIPTMLTKDDIDYDISRLKEYLSNRSSIEIKMINKEISFNKIQQIPLDEVSSKTFTVFRVFK